MRLRTPLFAVLLLAPVLGEGLTGATPPLDAIVWPPGMALVVALYGCGALLCREIARRRGLGLVGLCVLAAAYAVFEEAIVDRFWFHPRPSSEGGLGTYSEVWHTNIVLATNLTVLHVGVSIVSTIVLVELRFPQYRERAWVGTGGLRISVVSFLLLPPLLFGNYNVDPLPQLAAAIALMIGLVFVAIRLPGSPSLWQSRAALKPRRRGVAAIAFFAAAANLLFMGLSDTGVFWPVTWVAVLSPIALAFLLLKWRVSGPVFGRDGFRVVAGVLTFYCVYGFGIGLTARADTSLLAIAVAVLLWRMRRRLREHTPTPNP